MIRREPIPLLIEALRDWRTLLALILIVAVACGFLIAFGE
jgi:hypothetical protein